MNKQKISSIFFLIVKVSIVLVLTLIASVIIFPPQISLESANRTKLISNGTGIYKSIMAEVINSGGPYDGTFLKPPISTGTDSDLEFTNSTDYFVYLVKTDVLPVNWSYFVAQNIPSATGKYDPEDPDSVLAFKPENNAWSVVANLRGEDMGTPFLVTRNLQETKLKSDYGPDDVPRVSGPPYEGEALVVIRMGGSGEAMLEKNILWRNLNPGKNENVILRP